MLLTSPSKSFPTPSPIINPLNNWVTSLVYTDADCQGEVTGFQVRMYPEEANVVVPPGCNINVPSNDDGGYGNALSVYFLYNSSFPGYPMDMLSPGVAYGTQT